MEDHINPKNTEPEHTEPGNPELENTAFKDAEAPKEAHELIETDYAEHENNPGPSPQAVTEDNGDGAGPVMKWIIPVIIVLLLIYWFLIRK